MKTRSENEQLFIEPSGSLLDRPFIEWNVCLFEKIIY